MSRIDVVFDRYGRAVLQQLDNGNIINFRGQHIGFVKSDAVYNYRGLQVGWLEGGVLRDLNGLTSGFGENPSDSFKPLLPLRQLKPLPALTQLSPLRPMTELRHLKPLKSFGWSHLDPEDIFFSRGY